MTLDPLKLTVQDVFQHLCQIISSPKFLKMEGLGNEVPFFICPYRPDLAVEIEKMRSQLIKKTAQDGITVLDINLYDLSIALIKDRGIWEQLIEMEEAVSKAELLELLQGVLDPIGHLIPAIATKLSESEYDVLFLSGVGEVFPYIRSHNVLNNLQSTAKDKPTVMFFPGAYTQSIEQGASLDLFAPVRVQHDDKYYRAFNIFHREV